MEHWQERAIKATHGNKSQFGAILMCALFRPENKKALPRFEGKAYYTSDGFLLCDFVTKDGTPHRGAFVGSWSDVFMHAVRLADHLQFKQAERDQLIHYVKNWVRWN